MSEEKGKVKVTINELVARIETLEAKIVELETKKPSSTVRDRGPESTREMTEDDAKEVMIGSLRKHTHKAAAVALGLSYGQIYSARGGYTFKPIYAEMKRLEKEGKLD